jgi:hypothetical protein
MVVISILRFRRPQSSVDTGYRRREKTSDVYSLKSFPMTDSKSAAMSEKKVRILFIGTRYEIQRHQDSMAEREKLRTELGREMKATRYSFRYTSNWWLV